MFRRISCTIGALFLGAALWAAESANYSRIKNWNDGDTLTAGDLNAEFNNILNNDNPAGGGSYSATLAHMRSTSNPYPANVEVQATSLQDEITQLRFQILGLKLAIQASSTTYWYQGFPTPGVFSIVGSSVGVNQVAPAYALDVNGAGRFTTITAPGAGLTISTNVTISGTLTLSGQGTFSHMHAHKQAAQLVVSNGVVPIIFSSTDFDTGSEFNGTTFTATTAGYYTAGCAVGTAVFSSTSAAGNLVMVINGTNPGVDMTNEVVQYGTSNTKNSGISLMVGNTVHLAAGGTIACWFSHNDPGTITLVGDGGGGTPPLSSGATWMYVSRMMQ